MEEKKWINQKTVLMVERSDFIVHTFFTVVYLLIMIFVSLRFIDMMLITGDVIYGALGVIFLGLFRFLKAPQRKMDEYYVKENKNERQTV